jgi:cytochrome P450
MCDQAEEAIGKREAGGEKFNIEDTPTVYAQLREGFLKEARKDGARDKGSIGSVLRANRLEIASELVDQVLAGFDTSSNTLTWLAWQLSRTENLYWQETLREEVSTLNDSLDSKMIDALPTLHAILMETLRLHAAISGIQPRLTPEGLTTLGDPEAGLVVDNIPAGIRVQSQAHSLHRNPNIFPSPEEWKPERWLPSSSSCSVEHEAKQREQLRWFWAFSSGGRMCVGSNLAMLDMKATIVGVWGRYATEIVDDRGMLKSNGGYMAEPLGVEDAEDQRRRKFLRVKLIVV